MAWTGDGKAWRRVASVQGVLEVAMESGGAGRLQACWRAPGGPDCTESLDVVEESEWKLSAVDAVLVDQLRARGSKA